jgi:hypothetical protein
MPSANMERMPDSSAARRISSLYGAAQHQAPMSSFIISNSKGCHAAAIAGLGAKLQPTPVFELLAMVVRLALIDHALHRRGLSRRVAVAAHPPQQAL